jgi:hypothetical protein
MNDEPRVSLIALRDRREQVIQRLSDSFAADLITTEELEDRLSLAHAATSIAQVEALVVDLESIPSEVPSTALAPLTVNPGLAAPTKRIRALFGNVERRGPWTVPASMEVRATFGNVELDFRDARFAAGITELNARVVFGNLEIFVPPQLAVECEGSSILGNVESHGTGAVADPDRPLLRVRGHAVFGNIEIHTRVPGEPRRRTPTAALTRPAPEPPETDQTAAPRAR